MLLDLENIVGTESPSIDKELLEQKQKEFMQLVERVSNGYVVTIEDMKLVVSYNRLLRGNSFKITKEKLTKPKESIKKPEKTITRKQALLLCSKEQLNTEEQVKLEKFLANYGGKLLNGKELMKLMIAENTRTLNSLECIDKAHTLERL